MCFIFVPQPKRDCATQSERATLADPLPTVNYMVVFHRAQSTHSRLRDSTPHDTSHDICKNEEIE